MDKGRTLQEHNLDHNKDQVFFGRFVSYLNKTKSIGFANENSKELCLVNNYENVAEWILVKPAGGNIYIQSIYTPDGNRMCFLDRANKDSRIKLFEKNDICYTLKYLGTSDFFIYDVNNGEYIGTKDHDSKELFSLKDTGNKLFNNRFIFKYEI